MDQTTWEQAQEIVRAINELCGLDLKIEGPCVARLGKRTWDAVIVGPRRSCWPAALRAHEPEPAGVYDENDPPPPKEYQLVVTAPGGNSPLLLKRLRKACKQWTKEQRPWTKTRRRSP
jgi:hypothetical protein